MSDAEPQQDRLETVLIVVLYVVPLTATIGLLAWLGLAGLAMALLSIETGISAAVVSAKQPEGAGRRPRPLVLVLLAVCAAAAVGAFVLLAAEV
jgi:hypothetical protein